jgi:hypothetical protein
MSWIHLRRLLCRTGTTQRLVLNTCNMRNTCKEKHSRNQRMIDGGHFLKGSIQMVLENMSDLLCTLVAPIFPIPSLI